MKIRQLEIENYGIFRDQKFEFDARLAVVFGPNEAGKSTLLQLIRELLFGFKVIQSEMTYLMRYGKVLPLRAVVTVDNDEFDPV